ncbi:pyruvate dehydrogenase (acetyl-transferring) E1 component subunit alpha [Dissulfurispira thermophila]|uniref:Pyruvate dehydrogenase E1 component subunit alpha n=2 Tax=root TaxID=1 RepID=A0A7G1GZ76_9BACT|nr:pyruvate dehydrogenase (acetyl-transferring) E1 component subunit alpha [Dissulfurispira thermophila]BCB95785.1 pyruvate dehydrogenase (acetyl-transferring) E1 component subunit alpha [Dissulfurispira thermophila]
MPEEIIESLNVRYINILNENGDVDESLMPSLSQSEIKKIYELLILSRTFDRYALNLQREGRIGTYASILGQEASQIGSAFAIEKSDWVFPSFREMGVYITLGYPVYMLFQYWSGDERGMQTPEGLNIFPLCVPVGTQVPHAVGAAMAAKYKGDKIAVICYFGDGGTSKGDFHEGFNMAGVFKLPVVFICQNNQWAISVPRSRQTASKTLAQKAFAYGFEGIQVDGNDVFAVYKVVREALDKAKDGGGPTFIECVTYRMGDHTTADDASRYRSKDEVEAWRSKDPIARLKLFMEKNMLWTDEYQKEIEGKAKDMNDEAVKMAESVEKQHFEEMFKYTYERLTFRQIKEMKDF